MAIMRKAAANIREASMCSSPGVQTHAKYATSLPDTDDSRGRIMERERVIHAARRFVNPMMTCFVAG
jgi:hypothetical protein